MLQFLGTKMGIISSKLLKPDSKPAKVTTGIQTETPKETVRIPDVRSPTTDIERTPIIVEKFISDVDTPKEPRSFSLRSRLLKNLKLDPRSPTVGIYRTPILSQDTPPSTNSFNFESPVSIYSCNLNDSLAVDVVTPLEPSMNVSDFEFPKEIYCGEFNLNVGTEEIKEYDKKSVLKVSEKPNTEEAKKLLEEIISDEENFLKKVKMPSRKAKKPFVKTAGKNTVESVKEKFRPPLSNITSSTNSPSNFKTAVKPINKNKVAPGLGSENIGISNVKQLAQWDQNNTVII